MDYVPLENDYTADQNFSTEGGYEYNKIYREKSIPMIALRCPACSNHG